MTKQDIWDSYYQEKEVYEERLSKSRKEWNDLPDYIRHPCQCRMIHEISGDEYRDILSGDAKLVLPEDGYVDSIQQEGTYVRGVPRDLKDSYRLRVRSKDYPAVAEGACFPAVTGKVIPI